MTTYESKTSILYKSTEESPIQKNSTLAIPFDFRETKQVNVRLIQEVTNEETDEPEEVDKLLEENIDYEVIDDVEGASENAHSSNGIYGHVKLLRDLDIKDGDIVRVIRHTPQTQESTYAQHGKLNTQNLESSLDKLTMIAQENATSYDELKKIRKIAESAEKKVDNVEQEVQEFEEQQQAELNAFKTEMNSDFTSYKNSVNSSITDCINDIADFKDETTSDISDYKDEINSDVSTYEYNLNQSFSNFKQDVVANLGEFKADTEIDLDEYKQDLNESFDTYKSYVNGRMATHEETVQADIDEIQATVDGIADVADSAEDKADKAVAIAKGRATGYVFNTVDDMNDWLEENSSILNLGDNLYIRATNVPDYWWDGSEPQVLETQKVSLDGYATEQWVEDQEYLTEHQSLDGYATEEWVEGKGYLTEHQSLDGLATEQWVEDQGYLTEHQSLDGLATEEWVENQNYLTEHQSLDGLATEEWVENKDYVTTTTLNTELNDKQDLLVSGTNIKTINNQPILGEGNIDLSIEGGGSTLGIEYDAETKTLIFTGSDFVSSVAEALDNINGEVIE